MARERPRRNGVPAGGVEDGEGVPDGDREELRCLGAHGAEEAGVALLVVPPLDSEERARAVPGPRERRPGGPSRSEVGERTGERGGEEDAGRRDAAEGEPARESPRRGRPGLDPRLDPLPEVGRRLGRPEALPEDEARLALGGELARAGVAVPEVLPESRGDRAREILSDEGGEQAADASAGHSSTPWPRRARLRSQSTRKALRARWSRQRTVAWVAPTTEAISFPESPCRSRSTITALNFGGRASRTPRTRRTVSSTSRG